MENDIVWNELKFSCTDCGAVPVVRFIESKCRSFAVLAWLECHGERRIVSVSFRQAIEARALGIGVPMQILADIGPELVALLGGTARAEAERFSKLADMLAKFTEAK